MKFLALSFILFLMGCSSINKNGALVGPRYSDDAYQEVFLKHTKSEKRYDGFHQLYEVSATLIDSEIQTAILQRKSDVYQWTAEKAQQERDKTFQEASNSTKMFIVLFTPTLKANDLNKANSMWRIYLENNGQRYEGKATKRTGTVEDVQAIYPTHNRFTQPYEVVFNVPTSAVERGESKMILSSALGTTNLEFEN